jgi:hypothetical protein
MYRESMIVHFAECLAQRARVPHRSMPVLVRARRGDTCGSYSTAPHAFRALDSSSRARATIVRPGRPSSAEWLRQSSHSLRCQLAFPMQDPGSRF